MNYKDIEKSIIKKYRKEIWRPFIKAIKDFNLIEDNDKIAVCISGGKDSFLMAKCLEELMKHGEIKFEIVFLLMNPGYKKENLDLILKNSQILNINLNIFNTNIFDSIKKEKDLCYFCARKRRGSLYSEAKKLGCNKIALGHHFDDVVETTLMSMLYNGEFKTMKPILDSTNYKGMQLIRPLYYVKESNIIEWLKFNNLTFIDCACTVTKDKTSKRIEMKKIIKILKSYNKDADINIMNSCKNVNLDTVISIKK